MTMKKSRVIKKCVMTVFALMLLVSTAPSVMTPKTYAASNIIVNPNIQYQEFEGFGTSLTWFANVIGGWSEPTRTELADLLFDPVDGIGINVLRYNIAGGDDPHQTWLRTGADLEGYQPQPGVWDWNADATQRWVLHAAKDRLGTDLVVEAFSNSPPHWMTHSNTSSGNFDGGQENLKPEYFDDFAAYLVEVVEHFRDNWGITFKTLEPFNEPNHTWWHAYNNQEGSYFSDSSQANLINQISDLLDQKGLSTKISANNNSNFGTTLSSWNNYDETTKSKVSQINAHGYYGSSEDQRELSAQAASRGMDYWVAEADGGGGENPFGSAPNGFDPTGMTPSMYMSKMINWEMKESQPTAWVLWQAIENWVGNMNGNHNWGLIAANFEGQGAAGLDAEDYLVTKKYYSYGQYAKFIRPGYRQIDVNNEDAVAFIDPAGDKVIIVQANHGFSNETFSYDLSKFDTVGSSAQVHQTSVNHNLSQLSNVSITNDTLSLSLPGQSLTTFVIENTSHTPMTFDATTDFKIANLNSGKILSISGSDPQADGALVQQFDNTDADHQKWNFIDLGRGYYHIVNAASGYVMDIDGSSTSDGAKTIQWQNNHQANQQWQVVDIGNGNYKIINRYSKKLLDMSDESTIDGGQAIQWYDTGGTNQHWSITP